MQVLPLPKLNAPDFSIELVECLLDDSSLSEERRVEDGSLAGQHTAFFGVVLLFVRRLLALDFFLTQGQSNILLGDGVAFLIFLFQRVVFNSGGLVVVMIRKLFKAHQLLIFLVFSESVALDELFGEDSVFILEVHHQ